MSGEDQDWQRLDPKTLLTRPLKALRQFGLPIVLALVGLTSSGGLRHAVWFVPTAVVVAGAIGAIPWLTTTYRVTRTHLEIRSGLINRSTVTARLDRVRSVDLESPVLHQALGIVRVKVGTGVDDGQIELDSLGSAAAETLRARLLHGASTALDATPMPEKALATALAELDWSWLRFAPLNLVNLTIVAGAIVAVGSQFQDALRSLVNRNTVDSALHVGAALLAVVVLVGGLVVWIIGAGVGYALRWFGLRVTREEGKEGTTLHQRAGLLTTRSTTVEEAKVRGVCLRRQLLIAAAGGAELSLLTIGLEDNRPAILPAAPLADVRRVAAEVLGDEAPLTTSLMRHGRVTLWRYLRRASLKTVALLAATVAATLLLRDVADADWPWWATGVIVVAFIALWFGAATLRYRNLGHALTERHLVAQSGALTQDRIVLEIDGIVGWRIRQGFFDRRLGLAQLRATTAAGDEFVLVRDVPLTIAVSLAQRATPRFVGDFVAALASA